MVAKDVPIDILTIFDSLTTNKQFQVGRKKKKKKVK